MTARHLLFAMLLSVTAIVCSPGSAKAYDPELLGKGDVLVLVGLIEAGSDMTQPHNIDFFFVLPTMGGAASIADTLAAEGYETKLDVTSDNQWSVSAVKAIVPELDTIQQLRVQFETMAAAEGGIYDGWGAEVVRAGN